MRPNTLRPHDCDLKLLAILATCLVLLSIAVPPNRSLAQAEQTDLANNLKSSLLPLLDAHEGDVGFAIRVLDQDNLPLAAWTYRGDVVMPTASLCKLPLMIEAYRQADAGTLDLTQRIELTEEAQVPGSGILTDHLSPGLTLSLRDLVRLMIRYSDNTATNMVADKVGLAATAATMSSLGFPETQIHSKVFRRDTTINLERSKLYGLGSTTANDMVALLTLLETKQVASESACATMLDHLAACEDDTTFAAELPAGTKLAHKTGAVTRVRTDAGIIALDQAKIVLCLLTDNNADTRWTDDNAANRLCAKVARAALDIVTASLKKPAAITSDSETTTASPVAAPVKLAAGDHSELVEALQRTLNARIASDLSVDGDFGPATEAAVQKFQSAKQLPATGVVDTATWQALGELLTEAEPVAAPETINGQTFSTSQALDPNAPPEVSAKAWAILDVATGQIVSEKSGSRPLPMASTTKLMTAHVVLQFAEGKRDALDEIVTFSERADKTIGSTSGLKAGEQTTVRELLYGLMLPSGNDASVALAEHFGDRLSPKETRSVDANTDSSPTPGSADSYDRFVAAMNARAAELGLMQTHFCNPNGLTEDTHLSSANDLAKLASVALKSELLQEIVATRQRGCTVTSLSGYTRNVLWKNTNRLLSQSGFTGVKTGTTSAAGACLIAAGHRPDSDPNQPTIVVLLGSENSDARYIDARNLFAWAWRQPR